MNYYDNLNDEIKAYFKILCSEFPEWLLEYIDTDEMQRIGKISINCGMDYSRLFEPRYWYSNLEHSVGVALIIWNFTHDKKQTLAGLFHDIATPVFKHCIDFMNGDNEIQESTEERTTDMIMSSSKIMSLLNRDGIRLDEVDDYKKYPIADNDTPQLSADRFEYTFSSGLAFFKVWELDKIKIMYDNIIIVKNEYGLDELAFKNIEVAEEYISIISNLWPEWIKDRNRIVMQFFADMCKSMNNVGYLTIDDLYQLCEKEVIERILNCDDRYLAESFKNFLNADRVYSSSKMINDKYCVLVKSKKRYINPLVCVGDEVKRVSEVSKMASDKINEYLNIKMDNYIYFNFDFKPYGIVKQKELKK